MGDADSKFFFTATKARYAHNRIDVLTDATSRHITKNQAITDEILGFYKKLFGSNVESYYQALI